MKAQHTPGPWKPEDFHDGHFHKDCVVANVDDYPYCVCTMQGGDGNASENEVLANRDLIAAAPELLQVCKAMLVRLEDYAGLIPDTDNNDTLTGGHDNLVQAANAAIAKATGQ